MSPAQVVSRLRVFAGSMDGALLDDTRWRHRHKPIAALGWGVAVFCVVFSFTEPIGAARWIYAPMLLGLMAVASSGRFGRRPRELAIASTFVVTQIFMSQYVGNLAGLAVIYIIVLSFYQDWAPIALCCAAAAGLLLVAALDPSFLADDRGFAQEAAFTGMTFRSLSILVAAGILLAVWRSGTQLARDHLTGLLSRAGAERILDREIARGRRPTAWVCDLDNFTAVNAELGSATGDAVLRHVALRLEDLSAALPGGWMCARLGGDTFLLAGTGDHPAEFLEPLARRIEIEVAAGAVELSEHGLPVRMSIGVATCGEGSRAADLIRVAERGMRQAKGQGSMRVVVGHAAGTSNMSESPSLVSELYRACEHGELEMHFQPIVSVADGVPVGAEALVRWNHPERGMVYPDEFLPEAERDSALMATLSGTLGREFASSVAELVGRHGADWLPHGYAYNLAAIRLRDPNLLKAMVEMLALAGLRAEHKIALEVTEGALMDVEHEAPAVLARLRGQGYMIALDDFGTGHSSLAHLRDFPLDTVKIDKSFVQAIERSPTDRAVVQAVCDIAAATGLTVVAEGIETEAQREALLSIKPDIVGQGWLFCAEMPVDEFEAFVMGVNRTREPAAVS